MILKNGYVYKDKITNFGMAPGYRHMSFKLHLNSGDDQNMETVDIELDKDTVDELLKHIIDLYGVSSSDPDDPLPIDYEDTELSKTKERYHAVVELYKKGLHRAF